jgi:hypothetical protein
MVTMQSIASVLHSCDATGVKNFNRFENALNLSMAIPGIAYLAASSKFILGFVQIAHATTILFFNYFQLADDHADGYRRLGIDGMYHGVANMAGAFLVTLGPAIVITITMMQAICNEREEHYFLWTKREVVALNQIVPA